MPQAAAQRLWTSALTLGGVELEQRRELSSIINAVIRDDRAGEALASAAIVARGINQLCITRRAPKAESLRFPPGGLCFRGGALPDEHRAFFRPGVKYRVPGPSGPATLSRLGLCRAHS